MDVNKTLRLRSETETFMTEADTFSETLHESAQYDIVFQGYNEVDHFTHL